MPKRDQQEWVSGNEAAQIISKQSNHPVKPNYVRLLSLQGKIASRKVNERESEYRLADVQKIRVRKKTNNTPTLSSEE
jgi:hypothetical protein